MARDEAYRNAEKKIEEALRTGSTELDLSWSYGRSGKEKLTELPESLGQLTQLQSLNLSHNQLTALSESLGKLTQLESLNLARNQLTSLPEWLGQLTQLQTLILSSNQLTSLPKWLGQLTQLRTLSLSNNQLSALSERLAQLMQLEELNLQTNHLAMLPESLGRLTQLQILNLVDNQLAALPEWLGQLTQLQILRLGGNQLAALPESLGQLTQLQVLNLDHNQLAALPESFDRLTHLRELWLPGNQFKALPEPLRRMPRLIVLSLFSNQLETIPEWISDLHSLERLDLDDNQLNSIPDTVGKLSKLNNLGLGSNFGGNNLSDLPHSLCELKHLSKLDLENNPLNPELAAAHKEGFGAVRSYLRAKADAEVVLNEAKLILIGEGNVGKSSLLGALRGDPWVEKRPTTHGVEIKPVKVRNTENGKEIDLNAWDFGGQLLYRPTHQLFFTAPAVYLVVWEPRLGPEQCCVNEWVKLVRNRAADETRPDDRPRILIVATHGGPKERRDHIDQEAIRKQFGDLIVGFHQVDSFSGDGIDTLKQAIAGTASEIRQVGRSVPASWKRVLDAIRDRSKQDAYISYTEFESLCASQHVAADLALTYAAILSELGHLVHYGNDATLKNTVILKPDWLSKAISFVLEDKKVKDQNGLIEHYRLNELWNDPARAESERYPLALHPVFRRFMERFDLTYEVAVPGDGDKRQTSLVAQLVPGARPATLQEYWPGTTSAGDTEKIQVCRIVETETGQPSRADGLMYRLIVRLHRYSLGRNDYHQSCHWQRGMVIDDKFNGRALIEHIGDDFRVTVRAAYPERLLHHLCEEVKLLVDHFWKGLDCQITVPCPSTCKGVFDIEALLEARHQGQPKYPCNVCRKWFEIDLLLSKPTRLPEIHIALAELKKGQAEIKEGLEDGISLVRADLRALISQADERFAGLMRALTDEAKDGPRLFSLQPLERSAFNPNGWAKKTFRVTLWCEHTRLPLPLINKNDDEGVYEFEVTREWFTQAAPFLKVLAGTLSLVLPVAASATKLALDEAAYKALENQLDFGKSCAEAMLTSTGKTSEWLEEKEGIEADRADIRRADGGALREFQTWLKKEDPSFGDLRRVLNKRQEFLWVHRNFEKEY